MALRFWVGSSGNWSDTSHWSTSSGGSGGASMPTASDDVIIDNSSSAVTLNIILDAAANLNMASLTMTNSDFETAFSLGSGVGAISFQIHGSLGFSRARVASSGIFFFMRGGGFLTQIGIPSSSSGLEVSILSTGTVNLTTDFTGGSTSTVGGNIIVRKGTFRTNGNALTVSGFYTGGSSSDARTIDITGSSISVNNWQPGVVSTNTTMTSTGSFVFLRNTGSATFNGNGLTHNDVDALGNTSFFGSSTIGTLSLVAGKTYKFNPGTTQTLSALVATGTSTNKITLRSYSSGTYTLSKSSGTVNTNYLDIQDSIAAGGATWNTTNSIDSGNNTGWTFIGPTNVTVYPTSVASTSAAGSPSLYAGNSVRQIGSASSTSEFGTLLVKMGISALGGAGTTQSFGTMTVVQSPPPPPPPTDWEAIGREDNKTYVYRVYDSDDVYIGTWNDVEDDPEWTQKINTAGTTTTVILNRSPSTTKEVRATLVTQAGDTLQTEDGYDLAVTYETNNSVGDGTDVDINHNVDIYVHYGTFDNLVTQAGDLLTTEDGFELIVASGSPTGRPIFRGYILDYELQYGDKSGVTVTIASHGAELSQALVRDGETVVVNYSSQELATTTKDILDTNPGKMTYSLTSIENTGVSAAFKFQLNSKLEAIESVYGQTPDGFYWFGNVATNELVMKQKSSTPDHTFKLGYHIKDLALKRSQEQLRNLIYFVGAEDVGTGISKLKKYQDTTSQSDWRVGLFRITDRRYSVDANMQRRAEKEMAGYKVPIYTTTFTISSAKYDIETIEVGQVVAFANVENVELRDLQLQIMSKSYKRNEVTVQVGGLLDSQAEIINDLGDSIANEQFQTIPNAPS